MAARLRSAERRRESLLRLLAIGASGVERAFAARSFRALSAVLALLQREAAQIGVAYVEDVLVEQAIEAPLVLPVNPAAFAGVTAGGGVIENFLEAAESLVLAEMAVITEINDAARVAEGVSIAARPDLAGYVRYLNPPSCARCTILAGRVYRWSEGFPRHPNCDCFMVPVSSLVHPETHWIDPEAAYRRGDVTDLTEAEKQALADGADMASIVNVRRRAAGLRVAGRVLERGGRLTPEGIYQLASDRDDAIRLLAKMGYLTGIIPT